MTPLPRALIGPVMAMARPARPEAEITAVRAAAVLIERETGLTSPPIVAREIAARVVAAMLADIDRVDEISIALAAFEQQLLPSPIVTLATCPEIDTLEAYVERRVSHLRSRCGRYLTLAQQCEERNAIVAELGGGLAARYLRHLRGG